MSLGKSHLAIFDAIFATGKGMAQCPLKYALDVHVLMVTAKALERNFPGGTKVNTGPPNLIAPLSLIRVHAVKLFFVRWV